MKLSNWMKWANQLNAWADANREITRVHMAKIFGCDVRTLFRWLNGTTEPPGAAMRLLYIFNRFPIVEKDAIEKHAP